LPDSKLLGSASVCDNNETYFRGGRKARISYQRISISVR
jgi:hypothetical protein